MLRRGFEKEGTDGSLGEPRAVDGCRNGPAPASPQPTHGFLQSAIDGVVLQPSQKTIQRGVVGHRLQFQCGAQFLVLLQAYFGFAKSPVFKAHQAQHRQQLWLMRFEDWTFREAEVRLKEHQKLRAALKLQAVPDYTTLYRFLRRLEDDTVDRGLQETVRRLRRRRRRPVSAPIDGTGLSDTSVSTLC